MNRHPIFSRAVVTCVLAACLTACAGLGIERAAEGTPNGFSFTPAPAAARPAAARSMIGSDIDGLLKKYPIASSQKPPTWPRVAITVVSASPAVFKTVGLGDSASLKADDCAVYNVKVWASAGDGKSYDGLQLCYGELYQRLKDVPLYQVPTWGRRSFWANERNTGSVRGDGPVPPSEHFPTDPRLQNAWLDTLRNSIAFVGGPLQVLGLNWNDVNDKRVWFVSLPTQK